MNNLNSLFVLVGRNMKLFLRDKVSVFFSLLSPIIVLMLYILFLGKLQVDSFSSMLPEGVEVSDKLIKSFVDGWMLAGVIGVSCITVSLSANMVMIQDKARKISHDYLASPIKQWVVTASYFVFNFAVTLIINMLLFAACLIYKSFSGFYMDAGQVFGVLGTIILSVLSATFLTVFISSFLKTEASLSAIIGIVSAAVGFVIGAFIPLGALPRAVGYIVSFFPGSYGAALLRNFFMQGALDKLALSLPGEIIKELAQDYSLNINLFGIEIGIGGMFVILAISAVLFAAANIIKLAVSKSLQRGGTFGRIKKDKEA